jgi:hypothetical protein
VFDLFISWFICGGKAMGGVDAVVNLGINTIDVYLLGIFLIASFIYLLEHQWSHWDPS